MTTETNSLSMCWPDRIGCCDPTLRKLRRAQHGGRGEEEEEDDDDEERQGMRDGVKEEGEGVSEKMEWRGRQWGRKGVLNSHRLKHPPRLPWCWPCRRYTGLPLYTPWLQNHLCQLPWPVSFQKQPESCLLCYCTVTTWSDGYTKQKTRESSETEGFVF